MIVLGGVLLFQGAGLNGLLLMMIGWFGLGANRSQSQMLMLQKISRISAVRMLPVATSGSGVGSEPAPPQPAAAQADDHQRGADWVLVTRGGHWLGWIDDVLRDLPVQHWDDRIADHMQPLDRLPSITDKAPLWQAVQALEQSETGRLLVLSPAGLPSGTVDRMDLGEAVLKRLRFIFPLRFSRRPGSATATPGLGDVASDRGIDGGQLGSTASEPRAPDAPPG